MDLNLNTSLKQEQTLSPQMLQSLSLLPMTVMELNAFVQSEIESNPALEIPEDDSIEIQEDFSINSDEDAGDLKLQAIENSSAKCESLSEHLLRQLGVCNITENERKIGELLIGNLDANGFFIVPISTLFENEKFNDVDIEKVKLLIQSFDPFGICVQDFRESLTVQAKCSGMRESDLVVFSDLVNNHLERIKAGKRKEVASALRITEEDLDTFISIMKGFTPFPGRAYDAGNDSFVVPEFSVHKVDGNLVLDINKSNLPSLEISTEFTDLAKDLKGPDAKETSAYIKNSVSQAKNLIAQVELRYKTLYNCASALVEIQKDFFLNGPMFLRPMTLKDVALKIGVHETTMSRLAQSKWIETDWGLFQLKALFTQGLQSNDESGESVSRSVVKEHIADILKENPKLSDQKISDRLSEMGIKCARRTVSKYRAELNIDSSYSRI